jgi:1-acyl-sn-glycerol-3-phosphate acyltransferase
MAKLLIKNYRENNGNFRFVIVVKKEVVRVKLFRNILALIDTVYIDRDNIRQQFQLYNTQNNLIKQKTSIVLSPEGTRISEDEFGEFKSGAFKIAFDNMIYIQPVVIYGTLGRMNKNSKNKCKGPIYVNFLKPKKPFDFHMNNIDYFSETLKNEMEKNYFAIKGNIKNKKKNIFN